MPTFMSSLAANPSGSAGVYGQPGQQSGMDDPLGFVNNIKDREMRDYQNKANFMADLSLKQDRLRKLYGLDGSQKQMQQPQGNQSPEQQQQMLNNQDPGKQINPMQQAQLGLQQRGQDLESQRITQQGKMGQQALDIKQQQTDLNQQKSDSIHEQKVNELKQKADDSAQKLQLAQQEIDRKTKQGEDSTRDHEAAMKAAKDFHEADTARREAEFQKTLDSHQQVIDNSKAAKNAPKIKQTSVSPDGTTKIESSRQGSSAQNVIKTNTDGTLHVAGPDGKEFDIPPDKLDHWNSTVMGGSQQDDKSQQDNTSSPGGDE